MSHHKNTVRIKAVHNNLADLQDKVVYVGGATISLYSDRETLEVRPTDDIDVIVEILSYSERSKLEEKLRSIGFQHDMDSSVVCRYKIQGIIVDIMPTADESIGFKNIWYPEGFKNAIDYKIDDRTTVKILSAPYFIATKLEAFKGRGNGDGRTSHDFEDIVYVLENRQTIWDELRSTSGELKKYFVDEFKKLKENPSLFEWIDCHVDYGSPPASYFIMQEIEQFINDYSA
ncbi:MAG: nucleotidyl transferase AbiEii/AbiGii toxin family protein [Bacteroidia bacterium]|nr:nucleotidyl transferase AbiEii/AbiGii toxin family protein [Bacteroidia bacterium]